MLQVASYRLHVKNTLLSRNSLFPQWPYFSLELFNLIAVLIGLLVFIVLANTPWGFWKGKPAEEIIDCCASFESLQQDKGNLTNHFSYCPYCGRSTKFSPALKSAENTITDIEHKLFREYIKDQELRAQVQQALDYHPRIIQVIERRPNSPIRGQLEESAVSIDEWIQHVYDLALKLDQHQLQQPTIERDKSQAEKKLAKLAQKDASDDIERNMEMAERQIESLDKLNETMETARLRLDHTVSALGTIYSQTMLIGAKEINSSKAQQLQHEVHEEILALDDVLAALREMEKA